MQPKIEQQNVIQIRVAGVPHAQSRPRFVNGRVISSISKGLKLWRAAIRKEIRAAKKSIGFDPLVGAVAVDITFFCPIKDAKRWGTLKDTKPDKDNLEKAVLDVLEANDYFAIGDSQVAVGQVIKVFCQPSDAGAFIRVSRVRIVPSQEKSPSEGLKSNNIEWLA